MIVGRSAEPFFIGGLELEAWWDMYKGCYVHKLDKVTERRGRDTVMKRRLVPEFRAWPDGDSFLEQEAIAVDLLRIIAEEVSREQSNGR